MSTDVHLIQNCFSKPVVESMLKAGVNTGELLQISGLSRFNLDQGENYVPVNLLYKFLFELHKSQGIDEFYGCFANQIEFQNLSDFGEITVFAPDLLSAIQFVIKNINVLMTHERIQLDIDGPVCKLSQWYIDGQKPGKEFFDYIDLCYLLYGVCIATGREWAPLEIHLQSRAAPDFDNLLPNLGNTRILMGQPTTAVLFPTAMLKAPMLDGGSLDSNDLTIKPVQETLLHTIEKLLDSSNNGQLANMELIAEMFDISPRTMRRRLNELDTTFSEVVDNWRFKSTLTLLEDNQVRVNEISECLGYANISNFDRAFKRWTGQSPRNYRDSC
jgi:AraC-like DNA-binding protein